MSTRRTDRFGKATAVASAPIPAAINATAYGTTVFYVEPVVTRAAFIRRKQEFRFQQHADKKKSYEAYLPEQYVVCGSMHTT